MVNTSNDKFLTSLTFGSSQDHCGCVQGAAVGTICGIGFTFWLAIGAIVTKVASKEKTLELRTDNCDSSGERSVEMYTTADYNSSDVTSDWTGSSRSIVTTEMWSSSEESDENGGSGSVTLSDHNFNASYKSLSTPCHDH